MTNQEKLDKLNAVCPGTLMETLEIEYCEVGEDYLVAKMPVTPRVMQPEGLLHGGATFALAESVGSAVPFLFMKDLNVVVRGLEMAGNHMKGVREGYVYAKAKYLHFGKTTQLWSVDVTNDDGELISHIKFTTITLSKK